MNIAQFNQWLTLSDRSPLIMGVLNVTPDSFSDGGQFARVEAASAHAAELVAQGADLIDVGGESTRPGSDPVAADEQISRVVPVIQAIRQRGLASVLSIDTTSSTVAAAALEAGADMINDISAGQADAGMLPLAADRSTAVILMHMQGTPKTMQDAPGYKDVLSEVGDFLRSRAAAAEAAGVRPERVLIDPGIGFGKTVTHNLELLRGLADLCALGRPVVIGTSRKGFIGKVTGQPDPSHRQFGTAATVAWSVANGAAIVRVHDVGSMAQVVRMTTAMMNPQADFLTR